MKITFTLWTILSGLLFCLAPGLNAVTSSISETELKNFDENSPAVRKLISESLALSRQKLDYKYGSADPAKGGMDCSGFVNYILMKQGLRNVPRMASDFYLWVEKSGNLHLVDSTDPKSPEMNQLKPGDLLFWTGTYKVKRYPPITHVMIYLGRTKTDNNPIMVGSSDGRTYRGKSQYGVSVFDFRFPKPKYEGTAKFVGYGPVPGLEEIYQIKHPSKPKPAPPIVPPPVKTSSSITNFTPRPLRPNAPTQKETPSRPEMEPFITNSPPPPRVPSPSVDTAPTAQSSPP